MRKLLIAALPAFAVFAAGCFVPSLHPLYRDQDVVFRQEFVGAWTELGANNGDRWDFTRSGKDAYELVLSENGAKRGVFNGHLVKLGETFFLDISPADMDLPVEDVYMAHRLPVHSFLKVGPMSPNLELLPLDQKWLEEYLKAHPAAIRHERVDDGIVLTASTTELQAFARTHASTKGAFDNAIKLERIK